MAQKDLSSLFNSDKKESKKEMSSEKYNSFFII